MKSALPYGTWPSPLSAKEVAATPSAALAFGACDVQSSAVRWVESRPAEGGRCVIVEWREGEVRDVTPRRIDVRTRVHEYGGGAAWYHQDVVFFSDFVTGRLYRQDGAARQPIPLTANPRTPHSTRYADGNVTRDGHRIVCVREHHHGKRVTNEIVSLSADGASAPVSLRSGHDFYAAPRVNPSGTRLAWLSWDHPLMPWDGTELWVADFQADGSIGEAELVAGGNDESVLDPQWSSTGDLFFVTDRTGWWNLHRFHDAGRCEPITDLLDGEIGSVPWFLGEHRYSVLEDGRIACIVTRNAVDSLEMLDPESGRLDETDLEWTAYQPSCLAAGSGLIAFAASSPSRPETVVVWNPDTGEQRELRRLFTFELGPAWISVPRHLEIPVSGDSGEVTHAFYYPPANEHFEGPAREAPPLRVVCHGGPTHHAAPRLNPNFLFWTIRGIGVVDVNYRGSSGYGRAYRELLKGRWGELDWADCVSAARHLTLEGATDPDRTWIEGGSAGGYSALCALVFEPTAFAAAVIRFGVADLEALVKETHKFESHYLDSMIGPYPEQRDRYFARSPIHFAERLRRPMLLMQGLQDRVVPPSQTETLARALDHNRVPHVYVTFADEGHGFREHETLCRSLELTLAFIGRVFGFEPDGLLSPVDIRHGDALEPRP